MNETIRSGSALPPHGYGTIVSTDADSSNSDWRKTTTEEQDEWIHCGMEFGWFSQMIEDVVVFRPDGSFEILATLDHPVFPRALPVELKGIAV